MAVFTKNATTGSWTTTTLWSPTGYPGQNGATDLALWSSTGSGVSVATATLGQIRANSLTVSPIITNVAGQTLTLSPASSYSGVGILINHTTLTSFTLSVNGAIRLNESQSFSVCSGNTLNVGGVVSSTNTTDVLTKVDTGTLALSGANTFGGSGGGFVASAGITVSSNASALGNASNTVTVSNNASIQFSAVPNQTVFSATGGGAGAGYGAIWASVTGWTSGKTITAGASTVLSFRGGGAFGMTLALGSGVTAITLNGENTAVANTSGYTMTTASSYPATGTATVTLKSLDRDGSTARGIKYSIGSAASVTDAVTSGGGGLGVNGNAVTVDASGGLLSASASGTFNRNYTFISRPINASYTQFQATAVSSTTTFAGTLTLSGTDYVQLAGPNQRTAILNFSGTVNGTANLTVGSAAGVGLNVDCTMEINAASDFSGWTGALSVNNIRYGRSLPNANAITFQDSNPTVVYNVSGGDLTVRHSSYTPDAAPTPNYMGPNNLTMTGPSAGVRASWAGTPGSFSVDTGLTLTLDIDFTSAGSLTATSGTVADGLGTLVLSGNNTALTGLTWTTGNLTLNSAGSAGTGAIALTQTSTGVLDNTSGGDVNLTTTGAWSWGASFTWNGGTGTLYRNSNVTYSASRVITFVNGKSGTLKIGGTIGNASSVSLSVGGGATGTTSRLWVVGANLSTATTAQSITAGYYRTSNAAGLGAVGTNTSWAVSSGAALEIDNNITTPNTKNGTFIGSGPGSNDGALRSVSGANTWEGAVYFTNVAGGRIKVDTGSLTLGTTLYANINGTTACPVYFDAGISATLNQNRILDTAVGIVYCGNNGSSSGRVVLSKANQHTGVLNCESGTTALTDANAAGPAATGAGVNLKQTARLAVEVTSTYKAVFPGTTTLGVGATTYASRSYFRIGA